MSVPVEDKDIYKGQHKDYKINVASAAGKVNISGFTVAFYAREIIGGDPVITKTSGEVTEIALTDPTNGIAELYLVPADTSSLDAGQYYYDVWITDLNSKTRPILTGYFWVFEVAPSIVADIRELLGEGGELRNLTIRDELVRPATLTLLYTTRQRIQGVEGVWAFMDEDHSGTNYYTGGGYDSKSGKIWLGTPLPSTATYVRVSYTWESGISSNAVYRHLLGSRMFVINYTGISFQYGKSTTDLQKGAEAMAIAGAILSSILTINGANVAQMGYNFRLHEFEIQTKLWGEGMIAESLFTLYLAELEKWKQALGRHGVVEVATRSTATGKYDLDTLLGITSTTGEGSENQ